MIPTTADLDRWFSPPPAIAIDAVRLVCMAARRVASATLVRIAEAKALGGGSSDGLIKAIRYEREAAEAFVLLIEGALPDGDPARSYAAGVSGVGGFLDEASAVSLVRSCLMWALSGLAAGLSPIGTPTVAACSFCGCARTERPLAAAPEGRAMICKDCATKAMVGILQWRDDPVPAPDGYAIADVLTALCHPPVSAFFAKGVSMAGGYPVITLRGDQAPGVEGLLRGEYQHCRVVIIPCPMTVREEAEQALREAGWWKEGFSRFSQAPGGSSAPYARTGAIAAEIASIVDHEDLNATGIRGPGTAGADGSVPDLDREAEEALTAAGWWQLGASWAPKVSASPPIAKTEAIGARIRTLMGRHAKSWGIEVPTSGGYPPGGAAAAEERGQIPGEREGNATGDLRPEDSPEDPSDAQPESNEPTNAELDGDAPGG